MTEKPPAGDDIAALFEEGRRCFLKPDGIAAVRALKKVIDLDPAYRHPDGDSGPERDTNADAHAHSYSGPD